MEALGGRKQKKREIQNKTLLKSFSYLTPLQPYRPDGRGPAMLAAVAIWGKRRQATKNTNRQKLYISKILETRKQVRPPVNECRGTNICGRSPTGQRTECGRGR
ncbi:hypothetical protein ABFS82_03G040300 [Erythranthe guttata]